MKIRENLSMRRGECVRAARRPVPAVLWACLGAVCAHPVAAQSLLVGRSEVAALAVAFAESLTVVIAAERSESRSDHANSRLAIEIRIGQGEPILVKLPPLHFTVAGSDYALLPMAPITMTYTVESSNRGIDLAIGITPRTVRLRAECREAPCWPASLLPNIVWRLPRILISIPPPAADAAAGHDGETSLRLAGSLALDCAGAVFLDAVACAALQTAASPFLRYYVDRLTSSGSRFLTETSSWAWLGATLNAAIAQRSAQWGIGVTIGEIGRTQSAVRLSFRIFPHKPR